MLPLSELLGSLDHGVGPLRPGSYGSYQVLFWLVAKIQRDMWVMRTCLSFYWSWRLRRRVTSTSTPTALGEATPGTMAVGTKDCDVDEGQPPRNAHYMSNVHDLFCCDARDPKGGLVHAPDCDHQECFLVQGKK